MSIEKALSSCFLTDLSKAFYNLLPIEILVRSECPKEGDLEFCMKRLIVIFNVEFLEPLLFFGSDVIINDLLEKEVKEVKEGKYPCSSYNYYNMSWRIRINPKPLPKRSSNLHTSTSTQVCNRCRKRSWRTKLLDNQRKTPRIGSNLLLLDLWHIDILFGLV